MMTNKLLTHFFDIDEFERSGENWYSKYDPRWLVLLDTFRLKTGRCDISLHPRALGRRDGKDNGKDGFDAHNIDKHGLVYGGDVFPSIHDSNKKESVIKVYHEAKSIGFTGIGIYPQWKYKGIERVGFHLDTRRTEKPGRPAVWGYMNDKFVTIDNAINSIK